MAELTGDWRLIEAGDRMITVPTILKFGEEGLNYSYGNNYFQACTAKDGKVEFGPPMGTKMLCHMDPKEIVVNDAITDSTHYVIEGDTLKLLQNGKVNVETKRA